jgi:hypothetical protein
MLANNTPNNLKNEIHKQFVLKLALFHFVLCYQKYFCNQLA